MNIHKAMQICHKKGIIVYPIGVFNNDSLYTFDICVNDEVVLEGIKVKPRQKDSKRRFTGFNSLNQAITDTYIKQAEIIVK